MKGITKLFFLLLTLNTCTGASQSKKAYHPIVLQAKETSLFSEKVNWEEVNAKFVELTKNQTELKPGLQFLINSLGDKHATFRSTEDQSIIASYTGEYDESDLRKPSFVNEVINDLSMKFSYKLLDHKTGYLKIVGIMPGNIDANANIIRKGLQTLKEQGADKWIVDLRYNGGGDMNPMLAGMAPLIGEGFIGGSVDSKNEIHHGYQIKDGRFYDNENLVTTLGEMPTIKDTEKVVVLLSRYTISSGELVAIAFKGRKNTRFIGEETAGYTTGNGWQQVTDELIMCISESVFIDRNKTRYDQKVPVDEFIEFEHSTTNFKDNQMLKAMEWLKK